MTNTRFFRLPQFISGLGLKFSKDNRQSIIILIDFSLSLNLEFFTTRSEDMRNDFVFFFFLISCVPECCVLKNAFRNRNLCHILGKTATFLTFYNIVYSKINTEMYVMAI